MIIKLNEPGSIHYSSKVFTLSFLIYKLYLIIKLINLSIYLFIYYTVVHQVNKLESKIVDINVKKKYKIHNSYSNHCNIVNCRSCNI